MSLDTVSSTINDLGTLFDSYVGVLTANFLPIVLGVVIIIAVVGFVIWGLHKLFRARGK